VVTAHEIVVRLGRPFDIKLQGVPFAFVSTREIAIPFADLESAEAALREVGMFVRPVHDAGGEDYRPVVAGEVIPADPRPASMLQPVSFDDSESEGNG